MEQMLPNLITVKKYYLKSWIEMNTYQDEDVLLALLMQVVSKCGQVFEVHLVIGEIFLFLHVVYISVLDVLWLK